VASAIWLAAASGLPAQSFTMLVNFSVETPTAPCRASSRLNN
jgi:hypothetical protein